LCRGNDELIYGRKNVGRSFISKTQLYKKNHTENANIKLFLIPLFFLHCDISMDDGANIYKLVHKLKTYNIISFKIYIWSQHATRLTRFKELYCQCHGI